MRKLLFIVVLGSLLGCGTQPQLSEIVNDMVVLTNFVEGTDYSQYATYAMPLDTIGLISNTAGNEALSNDYAKLITSTIKKNLDFQNHTMVAADEDPDLGINVYIVKDLSVYASTIYPSYYYPSSYGYSNYYGYYGGNYGYTSYNYFQQAVLVIEFVDLKSGSSNPPSVWVANIGDLVNSYDTSGETKQAIDQAFDQSPFLKR